MIRDWLRRNVRIVISVLILTGMVAAALTALGNRTGREPATPRAVSTAVIRNDSGPASSPAPRVEQASDAITFARRTATVLFDWDTTTDTPASITTALLEHADPSGEQTPGLLADLPAWLPDDAWWQRLRAYETRQRFDPAAVGVPDAWTRAVEDRRTADLAPGTVAVTVTGVRHRDGVVAGEAESSTYEVVMTMFIVCPPDDGGGCWLARLGAPGKVLE
ncbi:hypothetical protein [Myceligenerans crystallogenes]|uniref:Lipoprotein LpqN n=1 Tax=Myceligenerans crystallogenes TaxID=316335 RepID=A0ABN2NLI1_9MICO